jgi:conjugative transfer signal peptidase TraF
MILHLRSIILICLALGTGYALFGPADFLVNTTHSMPLGLYYRTATPIGKGSLVSYCLDVHSPAQRLGVERGYDRGGVPLLKRVVAACGDTVSVRANGVFVDGVLTLNSVPETHDIRILRMMKPLWNSPVGNSGAKPGQPLDDIEKISVSRMVGTEAPERKSKIGTGRLFFEKCSGESKPHTNKEGVARSGTARLLTCPYLRLP